MRFLISLVVAGSSLLCAQQPPSAETVEKAKAAAKAAVEQGKAAQTPKPAAPQATAPAQAAKPGPAATVRQPLDIFGMQPDATVAMVDGVKVTAGDLQNLIRSLPQQMQQQAVQQPEALLQQYGLMRRLSAMAEQNKLDQLTPYKQMIENGRMQVLTQAQLNHQFISGFTIPEEESKARYEAGKDKYSQAKIKAVYIPFAAAGAAPAEANGPKPLTEAEAKAQAEEVVKQARGGTDFVKLVKEHSKDEGSKGRDGDMGTVARSGPVPDAVKQAIFGVKAGEVTEPVRQPNGFYVFRVQEFTVPAFAEVQAQVESEIKQAKYEEWLKGLQSSIQVKMEEATSTTVPPQPPPRPAAPPAK